MTFDYHYPRLKIIIFLFVLLLVSGLSAAYEMGDTLTVIQYPLPNISEIVVPGDVGLPLAVKLGGNFLDGNIWTIHQ